MSGTVAIPSALYRLFDAAGALLYAGVTGNLKTRMSQHSRLQPWWPEVARMEVEWHANRDEAEAAEDRVILEDGPRYNIAGADRDLRYRRPNAPAAFPDWSRDEALDILRQIADLLAGPDVSHAHARLRSLNLLINRTDELPRGGQMALLASQCGVSLSEAYKARRLEAVA